MKFVGRKNELEQLLRCYESKQNELVAVYGRRRVGKTSLVDHAFDGHYFFRHVGVSPKKATNGQRRAPSPLKTQLKSFSLSLQMAGWTPSKTPKTWLDAFYELLRFIKSDETGKRKVIFIDEIPWMDTAKSSFLEAFGWFINNVMTISEYNVVFVIAGSSTSWMLDHVINDYGGLYGRTTCQIHLLPFSLYETELALRANGIDFPRYQIAVTYMILGGIPYYLRQIRANLSLYQSVDAMFFKPNAAFKEEFSTLFSSMFDQAKMCEKIVRALVDSSAGYHRCEILSLTGIPDGQEFSNALQALEKGSFLIRYIPFAGKKNDPLYKLIDPFCLFYLTQVEEKTSLDEDICSDTLSSQEGHTWKGYAFENLSFAHLRQIKYALGISGVKTMQFSWRSVSEAKHKTQIDLVIEREDKIVNLCEMKFYQKKYYVTESDHETLKRRKEELRELVPKDTTIRHTLITTYGVTGSYKDDFSNVITLDELFLP